MRRNACGTVTSAPRDLHVARHCSERIGADPRSNEDKSEEMVETTRGCVYFQCGKQDSVLLTTLSLS